MKLFQKKNVKQKNTSKPPQQEAGRKQAPEKPGNKLFFAPHTSSSNCPPPF